MNIRLSVDGQEIMAGDIWGLLLQAQFMGGYHPHGLIKPVVGVPLSEDNVKLMCECDGCGQWAEAIKPEWFFDKA